MKFIKTQLKNILKGSTHEQTENQRNSELEQKTLAANINDNLQSLQSIYSNCSDVIFRHFMINGETKAVLIYIDGLSNIEEIDKSVLSPLMEQTDKHSLTINELLERKLPVSSIQKVGTYNEAIEQISSGNPVILIDYQATGFSVGLAKWEKRSIEEPMAESVIRGPRDGFTETLAVNTALLRRKIKSPDLKMISLTIGRQSKTNVIITYIDNLANSTLIEEVRNRIERIDIDAVLESGYIEEFIQDFPFSPFPQVLNTERPDVVIANLLEGRVAILVDGTPFSLIVPITFYSLLQSSEDYYQHFLISTLIRWLRYSLLLIALLLPAVYVAILTFHQEMVPTSLLLSIAKSREEVPFPALIEVLLMEITFEALREAGIRLPKQVGSAVSIVGALVIGQAAVSAGLVSAPMVMVVAVTGIASFAIPRYNSSIAIRVLRFPIISLAGTLGLLGIMLGIISIIVHLCSIRSFGVPYLAPLGPIKMRELKDVLIRAPWWSMRSRPRLTGEYNKYRQPPGQKPGPFKDPD